MDKMSAKDYWMYCAGLLAGYGIDVEFLNHIDKLLEAEEQGLLLKLPCKVGDLIDTLLSHNEIVALWYEEPTEDVRYDKLIWRGMAWDIPEVYRKCEFKKIFGTVPQSIIEADTINIRVKLSKEAQAALEKMKNH